MFNTGCWLPYPSLVRGSPEGDSYFGWYLDEGAWDNAVLRMGGSFSELWLLIKQCEMCSERNNLLYITARVDFMKVEVTAYQIMTSFLWIKTMCLGLAPGLQREYFIKDENFVNWNKIKCEICCSVYSWLGDVSVGKLRNRIIKTQPSEKWKIKELVESLFEYSRCHVRLKINGYFLWGKASGKLLNVGFEEAMCIYASLKKVFLHIRCSV